MKKKPMLALLLAFCLLLSLSFGAVTAKAAVMGTSVISQITKVTPQSIASGLAMGGAKNVGDLVVGNVLSVFGVKTPETKFREEVTQSLADIQKNLTDGINHLSSQITHISTQLTDLKNYMYEMKRELINKIDLSEFESRMTVVDQYTAKVDTIFAEYERLSQETDFEVAKKTAEEIVGLIANADLPTTINFLSNEFTATDGGSRTPLVDLYLTYLKNAYPFLHQYYPAFSNYAQYCELELSRAGLLYVEYCNYMQTVNEDDAAASTLWINNAANTIATVNNTNAAIEILVPDSEYTLTENNLDYHIVNEEYGISIWVSPNELLGENIMHVHVYEDIGDDDDYYFDHGDVPPEMYNSLRALHQDFSPETPTTLQFVNDNTGMNVTTPVWGCRADEVDESGHHHTLQTYLLDPEDPGADGTSMWCYGEAACVQAMKGDMPEYSYPNSITATRVYFWQQFGQIGDFLQSLAE